MSIEFKIIAAVALDLALGDPRGMPHPVRGMGRLAEALEGPARKVTPGPRSAGIATVLTVVGLCIGAAYGLLRGSAWLHPWAADAAAVWLIYSTVAIRGMRRHSMAVHAALAAGDLPEGRRRVAMIVGRDTESLDERGVARASVESVAEGIVDGVTAPLFFAFLAGPVGAIAYRAVNTLDSTFGYKHGRYREFGWASARLDDLANYAPARLTAPLICAAAFLLMRRGGEAARVLRRDGRRHPSPNAGLSEAAMAGALGVRLGGPGRYFGKPVEKPTIGEAERALSGERIREANGLALVASLLFLLGGLGLGLAWEAISGGLPV